LFKYIASAASNKIWNPVVEILNSFKGHPVLTLLFVFSPVCLSDCQVNTSLDISGNWFAVIALDAHKSLSMGLELLS